MSKGAKASLVLQLGNKIVARPLDQEDKTEEFSTHCSKLLSLSGLQDQIIYVYPHEDGDKVNSLQLGEQVFATREVATSINKTIAFEQDLTQLKKGQEAAIVLLDDQSAITTLSFPSPDALPSKKHWEVNAKVFEPKPYARAHISSQTVSYDGQTTNIMSKRVVL